MKREPKHHRAFVVLAIGVFVAAGAFAAELTKEVGVKYFFPAQGNQNPAGSVPNWYYYWTDELVNGPHSYVAGTNYGLTTCTNHVIQITIGANAYANNGIPRHPTEKYIDAFGIIVSHEQWHRSHLIHNVSAHISAPNCRPPDIEDSDGDFICDRESADPPGHDGGYEKLYGTDPFNAQTFGIPDAEWIAQQHDSDPNASSDDWAYPGSQWE